MPRRLFYRNVQAQDNLELFLVSAISSLLLLRFFLHLTGYPQVGGSLHIAHMLYGGLLMMAAIVIHLSFLGSRVQRLTALTGGIGFGIFIDELGKFLTKDNNYFFRPTIGLIYAIFAIIYLAANVISRRQQLSSQEYQLNALRQFEEAVRKDMDRYEKEVMRQYLAKAEQASPITQELQALLQRVQTVPPRDNQWVRLQQQTTRMYDKFWLRRNSSQLVSAVFLVITVVFLGIVIINLLHGYSSLHDLLHHTDSYATKLLIGQLAASGIAAILAVRGAIQLPSSRLEAFGYFHRAILVNLFLTEFFIFSRIQFGALPGFILNLGLLIAIRAALTQEQRSKTKHTP